MCIEECRWHKYAWYRPFEQMIAQIRNGALLRFSKKYVGGLRLMCRLSGWRDHSLRAVLNIVTHDLTQKLVSASLQFF